VFFWCCCAAVVVDVASGAMVEVAGGGAGGQPAEAAVPGQWAHCLGIFFFLGKAFAES
jgi:hypothetical protein